MKRKEAQENKAGWYSKPPPRRSLDPRYRYIRPDGDADGQEGVDSFLARLLFFDTLSHRQKQQAVETAAAAGRPHRDQALTELEAVVASAVVAVAVVAAQAAMACNGCVAVLLSCVV
ncbi:hypothetical protein GQ600_10509 [Phytophthora cactorum]|nr:hypothetical protein GQ600_10509 [Phytophthora cactorum]